MSSINSIFKLTGIAKFKNLMQYFVNSVRNFKINNELISSNEYNEFKNKLLNLEEKIHTSGLGQFKLNDRSKWRQAIENDSYDPQCHQFIWGDLITLSSFYTNINSFDKSVDNDNISNLIIVNNMAKALLQIEQAVEKRFFCAPFRKFRIDSKSEFDFQILNTWEKSLMSCATLEQLITHLNTLDESIVWLKSPRNDPVICNFCQVKGELETTLLCSKCYNGYHIYCLPDKLLCCQSSDEWLCPKCLSIDLNATCLICNCNEDSENMLSCDNCNSVQHIHCLPDQFKNLFPNGEWLCPKCVNIDLDNPCNVCKLKKDSEKILSCDNCHSSNHIYCLSKEFQTLLSNGTFLCPACRYFNKNSSINEQI